MTLPLREIGHFLAQGLGITSFVLAIVALLGTLYALGFALLGIYSRKKSGNLGKMEIASDVPFATTKFLVVIPAHNESSGLTATVQSVLHQNYPHARCVVIADNCTDDTAEMAAAAGAHDVFVRTDPDNRGKGHALTWAFDVSKQLAWDAACVIDADSVIAPGFLAALDASFRQGHSAIQARYDFVPAADNKNWLQQFTAVSKAGENSFIYRPREVLGLPQLLMGNGFSVLRPVLEQVPWTAHSIVEDAEYAIALGRNGIAVHYQEQARLWSRQATTVQDVQPQRVRWASGIWQLFRNAIPVLLATAWQDCSWRPLEEILMLLMTSRMVLIYLLVVSFLLSLFGVSFFLLTGSLLLVVAALQFLYLVLMFRFACDRPVSVRGLLLLPYYVAVILSAQALAICGFNRKLWSRTTR